MELAIGSRSWVGPAGRGHPKRSALTVLVVGASRQRGRVRIEPPRSRLAIGTDSAVVAAMEWPRWKIGG